VFKSLKKQTKKKYKKLKEYFSQKDCVIIAFSGGVDSSLLLFIATKILGDKAIGIISTSPSLPKYELVEAKKFAKKYQLNIQYIYTDELKNVSYCANPSDRCYFCKSELYKKISEYADENKIKTIIDGTNASEIASHRPGFKVNADMGIDAPYVIFDITKEDIREISRYLGLPTWNKASFACLSSRIPTGEPITVEKLSKIEQCENFLVKNGIKIFRVRYHDTIARLELDTKGIKKLLADNKLRKDINIFFKSQGFTFVALDLQEFRSGRLSEAIRK